MRPCFRFAPDGRRAAVKTLAPASSNIASVRRGSSWGRPRSIAAAADGSSRCRGRPRAAAAAFSGSGERAFKPHLVETLRVSRDKNFAAELTDWWGSTLIRWKALVLCVDDRSQIQALDRTQFGLHMKRAVLNVFLEHAAQGRHRSTWVRCSRSDRDRSCRRHSMVAPRPGAPHLWRAIRSV
jgi:hypothetical protein